MKRRNIWENGDHILIIKLLSKTKLISLPGKEIALEVDERTIGLKTEIN